MDEKRKKYLQKEYKHLPDKEIIELASIDKTEFKKDVYEIVMHEFERRGLKKKNDTQKKQEQLQSRPLDKDLITLQRFSQPMQAHLIKGKLESGGIRCFIADEHLISVNWLYSNAIGGIKLQIKKTDVEKAKKILSEDQRIKSNEDRKKIKSDDLCSRCGSEDIYFEKYNRKKYFWSWLLLGIPIPFLKRKWKCQSCSYEWKK